MKRLNDNGEGGLLSAILTIIAMLIFVYALLGIAAMLH